MDPLRTINSQAIWLSLAQGELGVVENCEKNGRGI